MKIRLGWVVGEVTSPRDGWVRIFGKGMRWRPAEGRIYSQRQRGVVIGRMWFGALR